MGVDIGSKIRCAKRERDISMFRPLFEQKTPRRLFMVYICIYMYIYSIYVCVYIYAYILNTVLKNSVKIEILMNF